MIALENVVSVYSGKAGKCCCGCAGKHTYSSANRDIGSAKRGYKVDDKEVNDRTVKMIVNKINASTDMIEDRDFAYTEIGGRLYVVYFKL